MTVALVGLLGGGRRTPLSALGGDRRAASTPSRLIPSLPPFLVSSTELAGRRPTVSKRGGFMCRSTAKIYGGDLLAPVA